MQSTATAQPQPSLRLRQDRHASLSATPSEPLELFMAADTTTTVAFNGSLDRDSLVVVDGS